MTSKQIRTRVNGAIINLHFDGITNETPEIVLAYLASVGGEIPLADIQTAMAHRNSYGICVEQIAMEA